MKAVIETWLDEQSLGHLPVFALGVSAGASFALKLPKVTRINGVVSGETAIRGCFVVGMRLGQRWLLRHAIALLCLPPAEVLGVTQEYFETPTRLEGTYPPTVFIDMQRDTGGLESLGSLAYLGSSCCCSARCPPCCMPIITEEHRFALPFVVPLVLPQR